MACSGRTPLLALLLVACIVRPDPGSALPEALRTEAERSLDTRRSASLHLAARAEEARRRYEARAAEGFAEQAVRLDGNPYAYLVLALALADLQDREGSRRALREAEEGFSAGEASARWSARAARLRGSLEAPDSEGSRETYLPGGGVPGRGVGPVIETDR